MKVWRLWISRQTNQVASMRAASVDIASDNEAAFDAGVASVDITSDNQAAFDEVPPVDIIGQSGHSTRVPPRWISVGQPGCIRRGCRLGGYHVG